MPDEFVHSENMTGLRRNAADSVNLNRQEAPPRDERGRSIADTQGRADAPRSGTGAATGDATDPLAGCPACHPVGTVVGAATGGATAAALTGLALGSVVGPLGSAFGAAAGAAVGAAIGGYAGKELAEAINPSTEDHYWRSQFGSRPYVPAGASYDDYREAYAFGAETRGRYNDKCFEEMESILKSEWEAVPTRRLPWSKACPAVCDAWEHLSPRDPDL
jgi:hypothetical protein